MDKKEIEKLIDKSKFDHTINSGEVVIEECGEEYVKLSDSKQVKVLPIWEDQIDEYEGPLYADYIQINPGYGGVYVRATVKVMIEVAAKYLPDGWTLVVRAGHRPVRVQKALFEVVKKELAEREPELSDEDLLAKTITYVADPELKSPGHCCGGAVDVDAIDSNGKLIDFGGSVNEDSEVSHLHNNLITKDHKQNRMILLTAMLRAGFSPLSSEWWHFSYGDQNWAKFFDKDRAIYGVKEPNLH